LRFDIAFEELLKLIKKNRLDTHRNLHQQEFGIIDISPKQSGA